jgi:hypothetical protein
VGRPVDTPPPKSEIGYLVPALAFNVEILSNNTLANTNKITIRIALAFRIDPPLGTYACNRFYILL